MRRLPGRELTDSSAEINLCEDRLEFLGVAHNQPMTSTDLEAMSVESRAATFGALGDPIRLSILDELQRDQRCVCEQQEAPDVADPPAARKPELTTWTAEEIRTFLAAVADDRLMAMWTLAATTGMRRSELLGLRWRHVDLDSQRLAVADTVVVVDNQPVLRVAEGKSSASQRTIALDAATVEVIRQYRRRQLVERLAAGPLWEDNDLVFCREDGSLLSPDWVTRRFGRLVRSAGVAPLGLHGLRHNHATLALFAGVPAKVVAERLGHATVALTLDRYSHVLPTMQQDAADRVADLVLGGG